MSQPEIIIKDTPQGIAQALVHDLGEQLDEYKKGAEQVLLLLAGSSSLNAVRCIPPGVYVDSLTISVLDERFDPTNKVSNFVALKELGVVGYTKHVIDTTAQVGDTIGDLAERFEEALYAWRNMHPEGKILALMGIGVDGHIAGIMPSPDNVENFKELFESGAWVVGYDTGNKNFHPQRVTPTITFLRMIDRAFVYMSGKEKALALTKALADGSVADVPARVLHDIPASIYIDKDLALKAGLGKRI